VADERIPFRGVRRRTAENLTASWQQVPHVSSFAEVDVTDLLAMREELKPMAEERGVVLTLTAFFVKATALGLRRFPMMNASLDTEASEIVVRGHRNVAVAVNTDDGLVLPVVADADAQPLLAIARELHELVGKARDRTLDLAAMSGSTFTISNYGPLGGWFGTSLVRPGETGVLGFGPAPEKPAVVDGQIVIRRLMALNGGADHRVVDGQDIIGFVVVVKDLLEHPLRLLAED
jgi:pyruvate dehydrogenase E2 component (dihydrolipoamide acetyltransferase)